MVSLISALSGVAIVSNDEGKLVLNITSNIPAAANEGGTAKECTAIKQASSVTSKLMSAVWMLCMIAEEVFAANMA